MGSTIQLASLIILAFMVNPLHSNQCPIGFNLAEIENLGSVCVRAYDNATYFERHSMCSGNMIPLKFYDMPEFSKYLAHEEFWVDYVRSYEDGPFINWRIGDAKMGDPEHWIQNDGYGPGSALCAVVNMRTKLFKYVTCEERHSMFCVIPTYENSYSIDWRCPEQYMSFNAPIPACLTAPSGVAVTSRRALLRATVVQAESICKRNEGSLLHRGYIYSNHPEYSSFAESSWELPLGINRTDDTFSWKDYPDYPEGVEIVKSELNFNSYEDFNSSKTVVSLLDSKWTMREPGQIFHNVMCEYFVQVNRLNLEIMDHDGELILKIDQYIIEELWEQILCFTDSEYYYPTRVTLKNLSPTNYSMMAIEDGYYWCLMNNTKEYVSETSQKQLYIGPKTELYNRYAVMICFKNSFNIDDINIKDIENYINDYLNKEKTAYKSDGNSSLDQEHKYVTNTKIKRIYNNKQMLLHMNLHSQDSLTFENIFFPQQIVFNDTYMYEIIYIRSVLFCNGDEIKNLGKKLYTSKTFPFGTIIGKEECISRECVGDFNVGFHWSTIIKDSAECANLEELTETESYPSCGSTMDDTTIEMTTPLPITVRTTTPKPDEQVSNVENELQSLANTSSVTTEQVSDLTNHINDILNLGEDVTIPKNILINLDIIVSKMELPANECQAKIVKPNIAIVVGDRSNSNPMLGIQVEAMDEYGFNKDTIHILKDASSLPSETNNEIVVKIPQSLGENSKERLSFILFKNDNAFSVNNSKNNQKVNSKVISISLGNTTTFAPNQFVEIHMKPHEGNAQKNETKLCAFWDYTMGPNGNWSTQGCKLLSKKKNGLDTCRCNHLTHFAQILRPNKHFDETHYTILSIISYAGCVISLLGLLVIGLTGMIFKSWRSDFSNKIWMHLSAAIALLIISFLIVSFVDVSDNRAICLATGITMHYSVLSSFSWMLISAVLSYQRLVRVFSTASSHKLLKACTCGWLVPLCPIIILCSINSDIYGTTEPMGKMNKQFCYPEGLGFWLTVILPVIIIVAANTILFCIIIYSVFMSSKIQRHGDSRQLYRSLTVSFLLFFLFGLTWVFGLLAENLVMTYLFCITSTLQGFVLFIFFVIGNKKTRELWCVCLHLKERRKMPVSSMSRTTSRGISSSGKIVSLKNDDYRNNTMPKFLSGKFEDSDSRFS
ncbi:uncharacterized protein LOC143909592 [Arctopsyche grandis]|uniref:uncharacterized protein LOC143909592 n=1 Tax=Arctopsyche grandis TaxID=121162 RepID=UPI00406D98E8